MEAVLFGKTGDHFVREGHDLTYVSVESDQLKIQWQKNRTGKQTPKRPNAININGTHYSKLGRAGHAELTEPLGFREIKTQYVRLRPQVAKQHDTIFLLSEPEATVAEVFKLLGRTDVVSRAQLQAKRDRIDLEQKHKIREQDELTVKDAAETMKPAEGLRSQHSILQHDFQIRQIAVGLNRVLQGKVTELDKLTPISVPPSPVLTMGPQGHLLRLVEELKINERVDLPDVPARPSNYQIHGEELTAILEAMILGREIEAEKRRRQLIETDIDQMAGVRRELLTEMGICPTCSQPLDLEVLTG